MIAKKAIDLQIRFIGDRRGGQHGVIQWMLSQFPGRIFNKNNAMYLHNIKRLSGFPSLRNFKFYKYVPPFQNIIAITSNYEDKCYTDLKSFGRKPIGCKLYDIIILRDPYNLFASKLYGHRYSYGERENRWFLFHNRIEQWIKKAKEYINKECYTLNYNTWFQDVEYRRNFISQFPEFEFNDTTINQIPKDRRFRSSFDDYEQYKNNANQMGVLDRWQVPYVQQSEMFQQLCQNEEVRELSKTIFGFCVVFENDEFKLV